MKVFNRKSFFKVTIRFKTYKLSTWDLKSLKKLRKKKTPPIPPYQEEHQSKDQQDEQVTGKPFESQKTTLSRNTSYNQLI